MEYHDQSNQKQTPKLFLHEWYIVLIFCFTLLVLAGFAVGSSKPQPIRLLPLPKPEEVTALQVYVAGEISNPGLYRLPLRATMKELLELAEPLASADLSHLNWRRRLHNDQKVYIPERRLITIKIAGAVEESKFIEILSGTRYCEVIDQLKLLPEADIKALRKKRSFIKEGECIQIPISKQKKDKRK